MRSPSDLADGPGGACVSVTRRLSRIALARLSQIADRTLVTGSGKTRTIADIAETAHEIGAHICLITSNADSPIGRISDCIVIIEHQRDSVRDDAAEFEIRQMMGEHKSFAPLGTLFETASMIFADAVISRLMEITKTDESALKNRHTNIE